MNIIDLLSKYLMLWIYKVLPRILVFYIINIPVIVIFIVFRISRDNLVIFLICNIIFTISLWFYILAIKHKKLKNVVNNIFDETKRYFLEMLLIMLVNSIIIIVISIISYFKELEVFSILFFITTVFVVGSNLELIYRTIFDLKTKEKILLNYIDCLMFVYGTPKLGITYIVLFFILFILFYFYAPVLIVIAFPFFLEIMFKLRKEKNNG
ncbi:hypothetical protein ACWOA6_02715 [Globicatella sulfidifaciens]|uniref:Uncharacterized protein n=1 Tax=Globicatella sulfidifaciens DSM 15739 TaxID=1121925 RepID=A0A1T4JRE7_9LACT|nr:hypothetical protein [Globicatella sulfidifaciens]SJZ32746.1 hypothetical protein SAMN02746011_00324 [Globicatella sulfidifaciens DSM 15739]